MADRPNVLWVSWEDTSPRFRCYGDDVSVTPNLDKLAEQGRVYSRAFSTAGVCAPSRACVYTGCYATAIGCHQMRTQHMRPAHADGAAPPTPYVACPPPYVKAFPEYLRRAGYWCTNNEKTDYQFVDFNTNDPKSVWDEHSKTAHWRSRPEPDMPFFSVFNPTVTHESGMWASEDDDPSTWPVSPEDVVVPPYLVDDARTRMAIAKHYRNLQKADEVLGQRLAELEEDGLTGNTLIMIWSDHGEGLPRKKRWPLDSGTHVPLIAKWPGHIDAGGRSEHIVTTLDLAATVLMACRVPIPAHLHSQPIFDAAGTDLPARPAVFSHRDRHDESYDQVRSVRTDRYRYVRHAEPGTSRLIFNPYRNKHPAMQSLIDAAASGELSGAAKYLFEPRLGEELYDTHADPDETENVAFTMEHIDGLVECRRLLDEWQAKYDPWRDVPETEMVEQWWPGGVQPTTSTPVASLLAGPDFGAVQPKDGGGWDADAAYFTGGDVDGPALLQWTCPTQGASLEVRVNERRWRLYDGPMVVPEGDTTFEARAIRYGYEASNVTAVTVRREP